LASGINQGEFIMRESYSILYAVNDEIFKVGKFETEYDAINNIRNNEEFDIVKQRIYLLHPDHRMTEFCMDDILIKESL